MMLQRTRLARSRFAPKLEALEDRNMLSASAVFNSLTGVLTITGTDKADHVKIIDSGSPTAAGAVKVFAEGGLIFSSPAVGGTVKSVTNINVDLGKGNDSLDYQLTGNMLFTQRTLQADLGKGNDTFNADLNGSLGLAAKLTLDISGGDGKDTMTTKMTGDVFGPFFALPASSLQIKMDGGDGKDVMAVDLSGRVHSGANLGVDLRGGLDNDLMNIKALVDVDAGGTLSLAERGQQGNDVENIAFFGQVKGTLQTQADGGPGKDKIATNIVLTFGSNGTVLASEMGGPGDDSLTLLVHKLSFFDHPTINAKVDGGPDHDVCHRTSNVTDINCETTIVVP
jgi:hypothetical protein